MADIEYGEWDRKFSESAWIIKTDPTVAEAGNLGPNLVFIQMGRGWVHEGAMDD